MTKMWKTKWKKTDLKIHSRIRVVIGRRIL